MPPLRFFLSHVLRSRDASSPNVESLGRNSRTMADILAEKWAVHSRHCHFYLLSPASGLAEGVKDAIQGQQEQSRRGLAVARTLPSGPQPLLCSWGPLSTYFRLHAQRYLCQFIYSSHQPRIIPTSQKRELSPERGKFPIQVLTVAWRSRVTWQVPITQLREWHPSEGSGRWQALPLSQNQCFFSSLPKSFGEKSGPPPLPAV